MSEKTGFVCPDWAIIHWDPEESTIQKCADGTFVVIDHSVQVTVFVGSETECEEFLKHSSEPLVLTDYEVAALEADMERFLDLHDEKCGSQATIKLLERYLSE